MTGKTKQIVKNREPKPEYEIIPELKTRFSPHLYANEQIPEKDIRKILEAARWAPSARNWQPWYFYWTQNGSSMFKKLLACLSPHNAWAKTAGTLVVACYINNDEKGENPYAQYDLGAAVLAMVLQAKHLGYYSRQMGLFNKDKAKQVIKAKETEFPFIIIALGKIGDYTNAPEEIIQKDLHPSIRKTDFAKKV